jgi:hypothetical protein
MKQICTMSTISLKTFYRGTVLTFFTVKILISKVNPFFTYESSPSLDFMYLPLFGRFLKEVFKLNINFLTSLEWF